MSLNSTNRLDLLSFVPFEAGSPWKNGYVESFNGRLRDELLNVEIFDTLWEAKVLAERWRREYNQRRPHSALAYRPPVPEAQLPRSQARDPIPWSGPQMALSLTGTVKLTDLVPNQRLGHSLSC